MLTKAIMPVSDRVVDALSRCQESDPFALVAGGCLRDAFFGKPVKDIDVFVSGSFDPTRFHFDNPQDHLEIDDRIETLATYGSGGEHRAPLRAWTLWEADILANPPIQIIRRDFDGIEGLASDIDFGFCQIVFDGVDVWVTDAFRKDALWNTATFTSPGGECRERRAASRARRLAEKYPSREFIIHPSA